MLILEIFRQSARELKKTQTVVLTGLLLALQLIVDSQLAIYLTPAVKITLGFVFLALSGLLFGPVVAGLQGAAADLLSVLLSGKGAPIPGLTLSALLGGVVYGCVFYRQPLTLWRALLAKGIVNIFLNIGLNTFWLSLAQGQAMAALLPLRVSKNLIAWVPEALLIVGVAAVLKRLPYFRGRH